MSFLDRVRACNNCRPGLWVPFLVGSHAVGRILTTHIPQLRRWPEIFELEAQAVCLSPRLHDLEARTAALRRVCRVLVADGVVPLRPGITRLPARGG